MKCIASLLAAVCLLLHSLTAQVKPIRRVLILNEVGTAYPLINLVDQGIRTSLADSPYRIEFYREYMETVSFPDPADQQFFRNFYIRKYQNHRPDVIITVGPSPLKFMIETHRKFFYGVPIVFCLPNKLSDGTILDPDFTGVEADIAPADTIAAALHLRPDTKHIVVVSGMAPFDRQQQEIIRTQLTIYQDRIDISYLTDLALTTLLARLKQLPAHTIVLLGALGRDATGTSYNSDEIGPMVVAASNAPVFSTSDRALNHGEIGGSISSGIEEGKIVGTMALRILKGQEPREIPGIKTATTYMFDSRALERWGMSEKKLPPGSILLNREPTIWESYKWYIVGGISLILIETSLFGGLIWQRVHRKKAEAELGISNERLRLAVAEGRSVGWEWDIKSGRNWWFGDLQTVFGIVSYSYRGTEGDFQQRVHPEDRDFLNTAIRNARESREGFMAEFRVVRDDGMVRWITATGKFHYEGRGNPDRMLGMMIDITDRKEVEQRLRESEQRFRLVANTAPVMIWTSGTNGLRKYFNNPWLDFTGRSLDQELGNGWTDGIHVEDLTQFLAVYVERFQARERFQMQYRLRRYDGEYRWIYEVGVPRFNPDGTFAGYIGSSSDITERKMAEEALATVGRRLIEAHEEERTRIGRELHDDINQRLALVAVELDRWDQSVSLAPDLHTHLQEAKRQIAEIAGDVQALSHQLHSSKLEFLGLATAAKSFCKEISEKHQVRIDFTQDGVPRNLPKEVSLNLFRILQEALQNAVKHSGTDHFEVHLAHVPGSIRLIIRDYGRGFDMQQANRSQGLGLISMRERVSLVKGRIAITSKPQAGTEIAVQVPIGVVKHTNEAIRGAA